MDYSIIYIIMAVGLIYFVFDDIKTGEYSMIRLLMELVLVYGPIVLAGIIGFMVFDQFIIAFILLSASVIYALTFRTKIIQFTESVLPPVYDKMNIDEAVQHLKKYKSSPKNVLTYLIERRNLQKEEAYKIIAEHFSREELNK